MKQLNQYSKNKNIANSSMQIINSYDNLNLDYNNIVSNYIIEHKLYRYKFNAIKIAIEISEWFFHYNIPYDDLIRKYHDEELLDAVANFYEDNKSLFKIN